MLIDAEVVVLIDVEVVASSKLLPSLYSHPSTNQGDPALEKR